MKAWIATSWRQIPKWQQRLSLLLLFLCAFLILLRLPLFHSLTFSSAPDSWQEEQVAFDDPAFEFHQDELDKQLQQTPSLSEHSQVKQTEPSIKVAQSAQQSQRVSKNKVLVFGEIKGNFYQSAKALGLSLKQIQSVVLGLQPQVDLGKPQIGVNYLTLILTAPKFSLSAQDMSQMQIEAALYRTPRKDYSIFRASNSGFYSRQGQTQESTFQRLPLLSQARISSNFNPQRLHPVTGKIAPHYGTDFAVPVGTPVVATSDGEVVKIGNHPLAGRYIVLRYNRAYRARFLHLSKVLVHQGQKVNRGQQIALSGATGRVTGPHLHFELIKFGQAINPMTAKLPQSDPLSPAQRREFLAKINQDLPLMQRQADQYQPRVSPQSAPMQPQPLFQPNNQSSDRQVSLFNPNSGERS